MRIFSYQVDAVTDKTSYCYVYCIDKPHDGRLLLTQRGPSGIDSCLYCDYESDEAVRDNFGLYVNEHLFDIISGKDTQATVAALMVETDFSLTIQIKAMDVEGSVFNPDSYLEYKVTTDSLSCFALIASNKDNIMTERFDIELNEIQGYLSIHENYDDDSSEPSGRRVKSSLLVFRKCKYPKIEITDYY